MTRVFSALTLGVSLFALTACGGQSAETDAADTASTNETPAETAAADAAATPEAAADYSDLATVLAGEWRGDRAARDGARNPAATLEFMGVDPSSTIIEIWPGGGWYADIIAPWVAANGGQYVAAHFSPESDSEYRRNSRANFETRYADTEIFGDVQMAVFNDTSGAMVEDGTADAVLTFRNVHNWLMYGYSEKAFRDFYAALRPGGVLGVVDHRLPSTREQDPLAGSGYVQQDYVIALAEEAGFELVGASEINTNPNDTADHPFGVWTLPPSRRSAPRGQEPAADFDRDFYDAIGESDRMTLLFRKPVAAE